MEAVQDRLRTAWGAVVGREDWKTRLASYVDSLSQSTRQRLLQAKPASLTSKSIPSAVASVSAASSDLRDRINSLTFRKIVESDPRLTRFVESGKQYYDRFMEAEHLHPLVVLGVYSVFAVALLIILKRSFPVDEPPAGATAQPVGKVTSTHGPRSRVNVLWDLASSPPADGVTVSQATSEFRLAAESLLADRHASGSGSGPPLTSVKAYMPRDRQGKGLKKELQDNGIEVVESEEEDQSSYPDLLTDLLFLFSAPISSPQVLHAVLIVSNLDRLGYALRLAKGRHDGKAATRILGVAVDVDKGATDLAAAGDVLFAWRSTTLERIRIEDVKRTRTKPAEKRKVTVESRPDHNGRARATSASETWADAPSSPPAPAPSSSSVLPPASGASDSVGPLDVGLPPSTLPGGPPALPSIPTPQPIPPVEETTPAVEQGAQSLDEGATVIAAATKAQLAQSARTKRRPDALGLSSRPPSAPPSRPPTPGGSRPPREPKEPLTPRKVAAVSNSSLPVHDGRLSGRTTPSSSPKTTTRRLPPSSIGFARATDSPGRRDQLFPSFPSTRPESHLPLSQTFSSLASPNAFSGDQSHRRSTSLSLAATGLLSPHAHVRASAYPFGSLSLGGAGESLSGPNSPLGSISPASTSTSGMEGSSRTRMRARERVVSLGMLSPAFEKMAESRDREADEGPAGGWPFPAGEGKDEEDGVE